MNASQPVSLTPRELVRLLVSQRKLWLVPAIACGVLAAGYSLVMPRYWEASQALVVRQETAGSQNSTPGKFADLYEMRTMQETILELAKSREVVVATIKAVDNRMNGFAEEPTAEDIEKFRGRMKMLPPDGGEFGKTEVFYFYLKDPSRDRAVEIVGELCRQLDEALRQLRAKRAEGLIAELEEQVKLAAELHAQETTRLTEFESQVGADLGELRMLHSAASGQSDLRQEVVQLESDARKFATQLRELKQLLTMLRTAEKDPLQLLATPNSLLTSQPALRRLKDGLVDAQLATARLGGTRSAEHPRVKAAVESEKEIRHDLHRELLTAIRGAEAEVRLGEQRVEATRTRLADLQGRLSRLAERRAEYSNRVAAVDNSRITLDRARQSLSTAKAAEAAARSGSLVTRIDAPETGPYPAGPGRTVVTGAGAMGGLMLGLGLAFLTSGVPLRQVETELNVRARDQGNLGTPAVDAEHIQSSRASRPASSAVPLVATRTVSPEPVSELWPEPDPGVAAVAVVEPPAVLVQSAPRIAEPQRKVEIAAKPAPAQAPQVGGVSGTSARTNTSADQAEKYTAPVQKPVVATAAWLAPEPHSPGPLDVGDEAVSAQQPIAEPRRQSPMALEAAKKGVLPAAAGRLPTAGGQLPPLSTAPAIAGLSLQEALQAARQAQH